MTSQSLRTAVPWSSHTDASDFLIEPSFDAEPWTLASQKHEVDDNGFADDNAGQWPVARSRKRPLTSTAPRKRQARQAALADSQANPNTSEFSKAVEPDTDPATWDLPSSPLKAIPLNEHPPETSKHETDEQPTPAMRPVKARVLPGLPASPLGVFEQLCPRNIVDQWATWTNIRARQECKLGDRWVPTNSSEIYLLLGILLYLGLHKAPTVKSYWETGDGATRHPFTRYMSRNRFDYLHRWVSPWDTRNPTSNPFERVQSWSTVLQARSMQWWVPGSELSVDEAMVRFAGRSIYTVHLPSKPIPIGLKVWCIAQAGFMIGWFWHAKGEGPLGCLDALPPAMHAEYHSLAKSQAVVFALLSKLPRVPPSIYGYHVYMDNLFSTAQLFSLLLRYGIRATGTARPSEGMSKRIREIKKIEQTKDVQPWGAFYARPHKLFKGVNVLAFKDNNFFIMLSSHFSGSEPPVLTLRHCPSKSSTKAKTARVPFDGQATKMLPIPAVVHSYNRNMNGVDIADQYRSYYASSRRIRRGLWKALQYNFLLGKAHGNRSIIYDANIPSRGCMHQQILAVSTPP